MDPTIFWCRGFREPSEQGHHGSYVLACPDELWEASDVTVDPLVYVMGDGARTTTVSTSFDFVLELHMVLL